MFLKKKQKKQQHPNMVVIVILSKIEFTINGNPLVFNMGAQWHIYVLRRVQCSFICTFVRHVKSCEQ